MHARFCSPITGRFLSVDPVIDEKRALRQPQTWNRFSYVGNNPIHYTDPRGTCIEDGCVAEALIASEVVAAVESPAGQAAIEMGEARLAAAAENIGIAAEETAIATRSLAERLAQNVELGKLGERLAGLVQGGKKAIESVTGTAVRRIPDAVDDVAQTLTEVKNVSGVLRVTNQLRDFVEFSRQKGYSLTLYVKDPTKISTELKKLLESVNATIKTIPAGK